MDFKWLEDFLILAETRSFSRSAELRGVTQSAFSRRIRALEEWLGTDLLSRDSYPVSLTPEGIAFRETAEETVRMILARRAEFRDQARARGGEISFLALHSLTVTFLPGWLMRLKTAAGQMTSRVKPENFDRCIDALAEGGYDFFLTYAHPQVNIPLDPGGYPHLVVGQDSLVAVARPGWPPEWRQDGMPLLQYSRGSFLGTLARMAQAQPGAPRVYVAHTDEASMAEAMKSMAVAGHGVVWLPRLLVAGEIESGRLEIVAPELPMEIRLYRNAARGRGITGRVWRAAGEIGCGHAIPE
ncbi:MULTISPECIES: LysR family transcriptional regulator [unclassified Paracoccus (in: a-proteobacteria)]|uniref:LysR family transcriptional regulator n=1 Tax=unclassified Paracoccus (in: a-proteobacteria) TaxID=2688777 RepID=UPI0012B30528|nr:MULTISPECIES: LysR substrate-binding domain-containing protein [unclassified Paracoccus (in: a-proteobacteria)]UXU74821.1 LysR substrate-binding domain-containing protein [Paracoccus sp. SMMA_5]UXU80720.1 LysR substrate-binding domain-containing protein [Paracoccus sp. SMMA_5_TC]